MSEAFLSEYRPAGCRAQQEAGEQQTSTGFPYRRREETAASLRALSAALKARLQALRRIPARRIIQTLAALHLEWARPRSLLREEAVALLQAATGYAAPVLDASLRALFASMDAAGMERWLTAGGVHPDWLDGPCPDDGGAVSVCGPELTVVVASGNIPGAALPSVMPALPLESPCLVKAASEEPVLLPLYARSLAGAAPELAAGLAVTGWEGGHQELEDALLAETQALVVYGSDAAVHSLRARLPAGARFIGYGHRISFSAVGNEVLTAAEARDAALRAAEDLWTFDQQGCLSPQAIYLERGGEVSPAEFTELLAEALEAASRLYPRRPVSPAEAASIHQYRASVEMRALSREGLLLRTTREGTAWTVAVEESPALAPCPLNRTAILRPVERLEELPEHLQAHRGELISAGLGVGRKRYLTLASLLAEAGVTRVTRLGRAQAPRSALYHDGVNAVAVLARFVRVEE